LKSKFSKRKLTKGSEGKKQRKKDTDGSTEAWNDIPIPLHEETVKELEESIKVVGRIKAVIVCKQHPERILSGNHGVAAEGGLAAVKNVATFDVDARANELDVSHEFAELIVIAHSNKQRRVPEAETKQLLMDGAHYLEVAKTPKEDIALRLSSLFSFSRAYVLSLLPPEYKHQEKNNSPGRPRKKLTIPQQDFVNLDKQNTLPRNVASEQLPITNPPGLSSSLAGTVVSTPLLICDSCAQPIPHGESVNLHAECYQLLTANTPERAVLSAAST
jgi:hypothetical protein